MSKLSSTCLFAAASGAVLEFNRQIPLQKEIIRDNGKDIYQDYESKDGNYKYHAEMHFSSDNNKDGVPDVQLPPFSFGSMDEELNSMMKSAFKIDSAFEKLPERFGLKSSIIGEMEKEIEKIEKNIIQQVEYESSADYEEESSADYESPESKTYDLRISSSPAFWSFWGRK
ncbi:Oidioi.mRNA.OKI2018_I69.chr2.g4389.t1.cds [Oikopleura dioica]|uniref:Oidioi.mRNA.OKI2018_I69.chr2.g4389.t1.cds n=1 Tax=Oikopleura dioica TaxID=34765 RepID=A0ABN7SWX7_OIKDI|nr:Oidioi.mRNA.OKI2018_I69.chr2.g4389.t1.cds [Oikopleura dioica]